MHMSFNAPSYLTFQTNISKIYFQFAAISTSSSTEQNSSWKVAVIVLGVLLGVALIVSLLIASVCLYMRRSGKYSFEPNGLLGKFAYTHL